MKSTYLLYAIVELSYDFSLLVTDTHGTLYYASLGDKQGALIQTMKKDFSSLKGYVLQPIIGIPNSKITGTIEKFKLLAEDPRKINDMQKKIPYKFIFGTELQRKVWNLLVENTDVQKTITYTELANKLGRPKSSRVVGNACASNKIALLIPCHRAVTKLGKITGYRWGLPLKSRFLEMELK